jgi:hypothetical protein
MTDCSKCRYKARLIHGCATPALSEMYRGHGDMWTCAFFFPIGDNEGPDDEYITAIAAFATTLSTVEKTFMVQSRMDH